MLLNLVLFLVFMFVLVKSANYAITYSSRLARIFHLSEFVVSFFIVAIISVFPEATISIISAIKGIPEFGLGTLLGSNVADLTLVFGIVTLFSMKGIKVKSEILKRDFFYLALLLLPIIFGLNGNYTRVEGVILILGGCFFFFTLSIESRMFRKRFNHVNGRSFYKNLFLLVFSLAFLLVGAHFAVEFGVRFANEIKIPPILVGLTMVSIGTCLPELFFSLKSIKMNHEGLALGDILGTVITDATIIVGILALIQPFSFDPIRIYVTGSAMFLGGVLVILFMRSGRILAKKEGVFLLMFYTLFLIVEFMISNSH